MKVKTFVERSPESLTSKINRFFEENKVEIIDIKYSPFWDSYLNKPTYSAMIVYNSQD